MTETVKANHRDNSSCQTSKEPWLAVFLVLRIAAQTFTWQNTMKALLVEKAQIHTLKCLHCICCLMTPDK